MKLSTWSVRIGCPWHGRRLQIEAIWSAVQYFPEPKHEAIFYDELCFQRSGFDLVFRNRQIETLTIVEVKGTSRPIHNSPFRYLKDTKTKGRQISWIWRFLNAMAYDASTADGFFRVLRPLLENRTDRSVVIARFDADPLDAAPDEFRVVD